MTTNADPRCELPKACRAKGAGMCQRCMALAAWIDHKKRHNRSAGMSAAWNDPKRRRKDVLSRKDIEKIAKEITGTKLSYAEIGDAWNVTRARVGLIAKEFGIQRSGAKQQ